MPTGLNEKHEREFRRAYAEFLRTVRHPSVIAEIESYMATGNISGAMAVIERSVGIIAAPVGEAFIESGNREALALGGSFDYTTDESFSEMRQTRDLIVNDFLSQQEAALIILAGTAWYSARRDTRGSIGLNDKQMQAVVRYRELLESGSKEVLQRQLRDRRFDGLVLSGKALSESEINRMVSAYAENSIRSRQRTVATTMATRTNSMAKQMALTQYVASSNINRDDLIRIWETAGDEKVRDSHASMNGQEVGIDEPFVDGNGNLLMYPGDPSAPLETIINCRCEFKVVARGNTQAE